MIFFHPVKHAESAHDKKIWKPTTKVFNSNAFEEEVPLKPNTCRNYLVVIVVICLVFLVAIAILIPVLLKVFETTTTTTTTINVITMTTVVTTTTTSVTTMCSSTAITTTSTTSTLSSQCLSYTLITDSTRNALYSGGSHTCDTAGSIASAGWFRFSGAGGTILANCVVPINRCGSDAPGWYTGLYPSAAGNTTSGTVCYNWADDTCNWSNSIAITNCNGYYVFYLSPPSTCSLRYCTI